MKLPISYCKAHQPEQTKNSDAHKKPPPGAEKYCCDNFIRIVDGHANK